MCNLPCGSIILFGSCLRGKFVLDTLFVVRDSILYDCAHYVPKARIPDAYREVVLKPLCLSGRSREEGCAPERGRRYTLYFGATYTEPLDGMFSFFPCMPHAERCEGFKRPVIEIRDLITPALHQGFRLNCGLDPPRTHDLWKCVARQVLKQNGTDCIGLNQKLWLGIEAETPEHRRAK